MTWRRPRIKSKHKSIGCRGESMGRSVDRAIEKAFPGRSVDVAFDTCFDVAVKIRDSLIGCGYDAQLVQYGGLKKPLGKNAHPKWEEFVKNKFGYDSIHHYACQVDDWIIDPTGIQFGSNFDRKRPVWTEHEMASIWEHKYVIR